MAKKLAQWGEDNLIRFISALYKKVPKKITGIGDDCAVIPLDKQRSLLVTTDALVEDTHFLKKRITPEALGYKSLAVNLSDIAAMGGEPKYVFLTLGLPENIAVSWIKNFMKSFRELCAREGVLLLGGDTVRSEKILINVTVMGEIRNQNIKLRRQAQSGDLICVLAPLGDSAAGLKFILSHKRSSSPAVKNLVHRHYHPTLFIKEAQWLAENSEVNAMMDLSDGLTLDLPRLLRASKKAAAIDLDKLPTSTSLRQVAKKYGWSLLDLAAGGGEDYGLLFTVNARKLNKLQKKFRRAFSKNFFVIGKVTPERKERVTFISMGKPVRRTFIGYEHF